MLFIVCMLAYFFIVVMAAPMFSVFFIGVVVMPMPAVAHFAHHPKMHPYASRQKNPYDILFHRLLIIVYLRVVAFVFLLCNALRNLRHCWFSEFHDRNYRGNYD